jgi:hypothetical protein
MELKLRRKNANAFAAAMDELGNKFNDVYLPGKLEDLVKLDVVDGKMILTFTNDVPEMVRIACYMCFVDTLL